jgi:hypothetical protein
MPRKQRSSPPEEINVSDLDVHHNADRRKESLHEEDIFAAGTPGGGAAAGGLGGTNIGDGDPDNADLDNAMGSGKLDTDGDDERGS